MTILLLLLGCGRAPSFATASNDIAAEISRQSAPAELASPTVPGRFLIKLRGEAETQGAHERLSNALRSAGANAPRSLFSEALQGGDLRIYAVDGDLEIKKLAALLHQGDVEWVEPVQVYQSLSTIGDPNYRYQWNMSALKLDQAHDLSLGAGVVVAVIDSGVSPGTDGFSSALVPGYDFHDGDSDASDSDAINAPSGSHGTHVAGTIAQSLNGVGVVGVAPGAKIMPLRVGDYSGISSENIAQAIVWAADHGAQVINLSVGGTSPSRAIADACRYAYKKGVVIVAAAGNDGYTDRVYYPAAYPEVIAVGAHDAGFQVAYYSNLGPELDLLAPGGDVRVDASGDGQPDGILQETLVGTRHEYVWMQGTSMASPHVAGAAALLVARGITDPEQVRAALVQGGRDTGAGYPVLDLMGALQWSGSATARSDEVVPRPARPDRPQKGGKAGVRPDISDRRGAKAGGGRGSKAGGRSPSDRPARTDR